RGARWAAACASMRGSGSLLACSWGAAPPRVPPARPPLARAASLRRRGARWAAACASMRGSGSLLACSWGAAPPRVPPARPPLARAAALRRRGARWAAACASMRGSGSLLAFVLARPHVERERSFLRPLEVEGARADGVGEPVEGVALFLQELGDEV